MSLQIFELRNDRGGHRSLLQRLDLAGVWFADRRQCLPGRSRLSSPYPAHDRSGAGYSGGRFASPDSDAAVTSALVNWKAGIHMY